jgi:mannose-1-phosphate guanylyltransferase/mannose-6-phosphate isomerase
LPFVEKPTADRAVSMVGEGCLWNSGIFVWRVSDFLDEVRKHCQEVAPALASSPNDLAGFFAAVSKPIAVDVGVLERSDRVAVIAGFGWDDVGRAARVRAADSGNVAWDRCTVNATGTVHAEGNEAVPTACPTSSS